MKSSNTRDALEQVSLPLLPLFDHVLLPGGFVRVLIPPAWRKSAALVQHLLQQQRGDVFVAAVPYTAGKALDEGGLSEEEHLDLERLHHTGTAARVLQLLKRTQSGGWMVTLEGRCRVKVKDVTLSPLSEVLVAAVEQLDYFGATPSPFGTSPAPGAGSPAAKSHVAGKGGAPGGGRRGGAAAEEGGPATRQQEELVQELLQGMRQLFMLLQGGAEGRESGARVTQMLQPQGPARVADVLGALVARDSKDRLALLSTTDTTKRLELARELMSKMLLAAARVAGAAGGAGGMAGDGRRGLDPSGAGGTRSRRTGLPFRISDLGGGGGGEEGEDGDSKEELKALMRRLQDSNPPPEVLRVALREYKRLARSSEQHPGHAMSLAYLETLAELPWNTWSHQLPAAQGQGNGQQGNGQEQGQVQGELGQQHEEHEQQGEEEGGRGGATLAGTVAGGEAAEGVVHGQQGGGELSLREVRERLDAAHYGLEKIKERIVQYVAVQRLRGWDARAPILCFIGPPGVGKTSLARCVGEVLGRPFQRISLGGVRDEAEIRGHRRTYIGAMPGRVIQAVRRAGVRDPVLLLDEVDKMGRDARGDPAAALLEVLDPEQNHAFTDTYLGVPFDLSAVVFLSTANRASDIPAPLLDRMEVVNLAGYTLDEKVHIAERHLVPRALREHGLLPGQLAFPPEAVRLLVEGYTREAGVRTLARCLAAVCRHVAVQVVSEREEGGAAAGAALPMRPGALGVVEDVAAGAAGPLGGSHAGRRGRHLPGRASVQAVAAQQQQQGQQELSGAGLGAVVAGRAGWGEPIAALDFASRPAGGEGAAQLWQLLQGLELPKIQTQQAKRSGSRWGRRGSGATAAVTHVLGGYPWPRLGPLLAQGHSPPGSPKGQLSSDGGQQQQGGGGGWFSWLSVMPWGTAGRHLAERHAEVEEERFAQHAQQGHTGTSGSSSGARDAWASVSDLDSPPEHVAAGHSMSLAGSMHSMACGPWQHAASAIAEAAALPMGAPSSLLHLQSPWEGEGWAAAAAPGARTGATYRALTGDAGEEGPVLLGAQQQLPLQGGGRAGFDPLAQVLVDEALIEEVLGPRRFTGHDNSERVASPGTAAGLVWTAVGGQVQYIECLCVGTSRGDGNGSLTLTGQLGDVLEESARIALSWVRAHAAALGLPGGPSCPAATWDVHIHLPAGAVPKDGPSAGVTLATALVSLFTGRCVRADTAMTGELTLRGLVLPVGGMKEKLLAAHTAGMGRVVVPARNMRDVQADVPQGVREALEVLPAERLEDVLRNAFDPPLDLQLRARL